MWRKVLLVREDQPVRVLHEAIVHRGREPHSCDCGQQVGRAQLKARHSLCARVRENKDAMAAASAILGDGSNDADTDMLSSSTSVVRLP